MTTQTLIELRKLAEAATQGTWTVENVPGAGIQMRVPYQGSTRLTFVEVWRGLPEDWDKELWANAVYITKACPAKIIELLDALEAQAAEIERLKNLVVWNQEQREIDIAIGRKECDELRAELAGGCPVRVCSTRRKKMTEQELSQLFFDTTGELASIEVRTYRNFNRAFELGVTAEREACARVCDALSRKAGRVTCGVESLEGDAGYECATAIRLRSNA
jgi:hypothetical protein